jgi:tRNA (adenine37-N6)-methyltransferase
MTNSKIVYKPIGVIHSEHVDQEKTPIQPVYASGCEGHVEVFPEYAEGLRDLEDFSHIYLVYHLHRSGPQKLVVKPFLQDIEHGVFATRKECRPNPIGLSIVELVSRQENILRIKNVDILDGTPLLDIKPYTRRFDHIETSRNGWQDSVDEETAKRRGKRSYTGNL